MNTQDASPVTEMDPVHSIVPFMYGGLLIMLLGFLVGYSNIERRGKLGIGIMLGGFLMTNGAIAIEVYSSLQNG